MPDKTSRTGLYPAAEWKPGNHHGAFDWSGHDQEDLPGGVKRQMHAESAHGTKGEATVKLAKVQEQAAQSPSVKGAAGPTPLLSTLKKRAGDTAAPETPSPYAKAIKIRKPKNAAK